MSGKLLLAGIHPEGTPLGEYADAAWAVQVDYLLTATSDTAEIVDQHWAAVTAPAPAVTTSPGSGGARPTRDEHGPPNEAEILAWAANPRAQAGQRTLMGEAPGGAAPKARS